MTDDEWETQRRTQLTNRARLGWMTLPGQQSTPTTYTHGTRYAYATKKCRCHDCMEWRRQYQRQRWARNHPGAKPRPNAWASYPSVTTEEET